MWTIRVFPDYQSSGLWGDGGNWDESDFEGVLSHADLMALKYWHQAWELLIMDGAQDNPPVQRMRDSYIARWSKDGTDLVESWNSKQSVFKFIYEGDYWK